ncbi:kinesin-like protein KIF20A [Periplaneta americana]|uniref:kinesin-like protein KIF20A n=1 Tax=Periplaneta americana TaxID=6978 RepID=UPI0037E849F3
MENLSFFNPRHPSICNADIPFPITRTNLYPFLEESEIDTESPSCGNLKVFLRIKPEIKDATILSHVMEETFKVKDSTTLLMRSSKDPLIHEFRFTKIFKPDASQAEVYEESVHKLVQKFIGGQNCLLFTYGSSSAGKTYTVQGTHVDPGIIPRAITVLFNSIQGRESSSCKYKPDMVSRIVQLDEKSIHEELAYKEKILSWTKDKCSGYDSIHSSKSTLFSNSDISLEKQSENSYSTISSNTDFVSNSFRTMQTNLSTSEMVDIEGNTSDVFSVWVSFAEIYNENIFDLLEFSRGENKQKLLLGQDENSEVYIKGLRHICVNSGDEAYQVMLFGKHNLKFAPTGLNSVSSRSHCIFTIRLLRHMKTDPPSYFQLSMFSFCDLAGVERLRNTHNVGERLKESQNINTSLLVLGRCLTTIRDNQMCKRKKLVPFRDSKLTKLFRKSLTENGSISMIVNVTPSPLLKEETFNILLFSAVAKQIVIQPPRPKKRVPRTSRFSQYMSKNSTLSSSTTTTATARGDESSLSVDSSREIQQLHARIEELENKLAAERDKALNIETELRQELGKEFFRIFTESQTEWEHRWEEAKLRQEEIYDWRVKKLEQHYKEQTRKRQRYDDEFLEESYSKQVSEREVEVLKENLMETNQLYRASQQQQHELSERCSKLTFELAQCQADLKNAQRLREAAFQGDETLSREVENQLATVKEQLKKYKDKVQELEGVLQDAQMDHEHLVKELDEAERVREELSVTLSDKEASLQRCLQDLLHKQRILDKQLCTLDEKDERIAALESEVKKFQDNVDNGEIQKWDVMCDALQEENKDLNKKLKEAQNIDKNEIKKWKEMCEALQVENEDLNKKLKEAQNVDKDEIKKWKEMCEVLQVENEDLNKKLKEAQNVDNNEIKKLKEMCEALQVESEDLNKKLKEAQNVDKDEIKKWKEMCEALQVENEDLNKKLKEAQNVDKDEIKKWKEMCEVLQVENEDLNKKLKDSEDMISKSTKQKEISQKEIQELNLQKDDLEEKLHSVEKAQKNTIKEMINAQNSAEEQRKHYEESALEMQNEISKLKTQLQSCIDNADFVRSLKEELQNKSERYKNLEEENESLKNALKTQDTEMDHFKENRDVLIKMYEDALKKEKEERERTKREVQRYQEMFMKSTPTPSKREYEKRAPLKPRPFLENKQKPRVEKIRLLKEEIALRDVELKTCYVKVTRLEDEIKSKHRVNDELLNEELKQLTISTHSKEIQGSRRTRKKVTDENMHPSELTISEKKKLQPSKLKQNAESLEKRSKSRRRNLFSSNNFDESLELDPVETEETIPSQSPGRILRSRRM